MATHPQSDRFRSDVLDLTVDEHLDVLVAEERSLLDADPAALTADGVLDFLAQVQAQQAWLATLEVDGLVALAGAHARRREFTVIDPESDAERRLVIEDEACEEAAAALRRSPVQVRHQVADARLLAGPLARTRCALEAGRITAGHARVMVDAARRLSCASIAWQDPATDSPDDAGQRAAFHEACERLQDRLLQAAERSTVARMRTLARHVVTAIDAAGQEERRRQARVRIGVTVTAEDDGLALLEARLPTLDAARAWAALEARARTQVGECDATLGELRAAALVDALCGGGAEGCRADAPGATVTASISVTVPLDALLGLADDPATVSVGTGAPEPLDVEALRELLRRGDAPATVRRLVTDPMTGRMIDRGRRAYAVDDALRAFLALRDGVCRFPGCLRAAVSCQVDHAIAWDDGGATDRDNLGPLCTRHHQLKTHGGWEITHSSADGTCTWRSPLGRVYHWEPFDPVTRSPAQTTGPSRPRGAPPAAPRDPDPPPF